MVLFNTLGQYYLVNNLEKSSYFVWLIITYTIYTDNDGWMWSRVENHELLN